MPQKILVVDDDEDLRRMFRLTLSVAGFAVKEARGGFEAIRLLDADPPDLVILDLAMPNIDGFAVWRELQAHPHTRRIPVVVVTALEAEAVTGLDVQCVVTKPVMPADLVTVVRRCLAASSGAGV